MVDAVEGMEAVGWKGGKRRAKMIDNMDNIKEKSSYRNMKRLAKDREEWKTNMSKADYIHRYFLWQKTTYIDTIYVCSLLPLKSLHMLVLCDLLFMFT